MMKISIIIPCLGELEDTKTAWGCLIANTPDYNNEVELIVIDNNSPDDTVSFLERFVFPHFPNHKLIHNEVNAGVAGSLKQGYEASSGEIIAFLHNDLAIYEKMWNYKMIGLFDNESKVGLVGFFGAKGAAANGGRFNCLSNLLEAEAHGERSSNSAEVVLFDGIALIVRRQMIEEIGGFPTDFDYWFYDKNLSLESYTHGWKNIFVGIHCHHRSGVTANRANYQQQVAQQMGLPLDQAHTEAFKQAEKRFLDKWGGRLPISVS